MFGKGKLILGLVIGLLSAVVIACVTVGVGCAINGLTFGEQICEWFGSNAEIVEETVDTVNTVACNLIA